MAFPPHIGRSRGPKCRVRDRARRGMNGRLDHEHRRAVGQAGTEVKPPDQPAGSPDRRREAGTEEQVRARRREAVTRTPPWWPVLRRRNADRPRRKRVALLVDEQPGAALVAADLVPSAALAGSTVPAVESSGSSAAGRNGRRVALAPPRLPPRRRRRSWRRQHELDGERRLAGAASPGECDTRPSIPLRLHGTAPALRDRGDREHLRGQEALPPPGSTGPGASGLALRPAR